jgi:diaminopimelate decarboxylase
VGELSRVLRAGGAAGKTVFSGVGKTEKEIGEALEAGIHSFNCESAGELETLSAVAVRMGRRAPVALRVNPDVDAATHPYISTGMREHKFGIAMSDVEGICGEARGLTGVEITGVSCHIGSQILDFAPMLEAAERMVELAARLRGRGFGIRSLDLGGGLGIAYHAGQAGPAIGEFARALRGRIEGSGLEVMVEPGRSIVGEAGVLLTRVLYRKRSGGKEFAIVDAAMNDLIRPALYQAHHEILALAERKETVRADVVGPVCETGDFFARNRDIPDVGPGEYVALASAGAYGFSQSSNYNSRPRAAEVLVEGGKWRVVRERETYESLVAGERV